MAESRLRVALDARPLSHPQAGGFRAYVRSLTRGLRERAEAGSNDVDLIYYLDRPLSPSVEASLPRGAKVRILDTRRIPTDLLFFPRAVRRDAPDLVHGTMNYLPPLPGRRSTVTIHDAMGLRSHPWERTVKWRLRDRLVNRYWYVLTLLSLRQARRIVTVSQGSAAEIEAATGQAAERFRVVYNGVDLPEPSPDTARCPGTVLIFHSPDSRKNSKCVYRAFAESPRLMQAVSCLNIVCTGEKTESWAREAVARYGIQKHRLLRGLSDPALSDAYASASVFVWPSRLEGFGLPPLEAMRNGCPVVSSSAPVMPEVLGDAPLYFAPDQPDELAERLLTLLNDPAEAARRGVAGRQIAAQFTCRRMADETVAVWKEAAGG